jgi:3-oxoacyl-[acyl-carrier-protein] synthase III
MSHLDTVLAAPPRRPRTVRTAGIAALGAALPPRVVDNAEIAPALGVDSGWIVQRTGISRRRRVSEDQPLADLAAAAGRRALDAAPLAAAELDAVLVATATPDGFMPPTAPIVASALGAERAMAWDVGLACSGFVAALVQAAALVESGRASNVLVIGAEVMSRYVDPDDRSTAMLFGDGAGAALVVGGGAAEIGAGVLGADGGMGAALDTDPATGCMRMDGHTVFMHAVPRMAGAALEALEAAGRQLDEVDLVVAHQANARITRALAARLDLPADRVVDVIGETGNTSAASIPLALAHATAAGRVPDEGLVLLCAFGAGFAWGATVLQTTGERIAVDAGELA